MGGAAFPVAATGAAAVAGRALTGVVRGTGRATWPVPPTRVAAAALTRASRSAARSGARPAHSRRRLSSRAWEKTSSERIAIASSAAKAAMAPICVNVFDSESASGREVMNPGSVRGE
ncbi:MAG TPA: hypothetical protein VHY83_10425 [Solirubrobacteraceae bacterium]|nr:hypothetical protein [Solirubrobacteraceae bacterium]